jgi:hypothetical protein
MATRFIGKRGPTMESSVSTYLPRTRTHSIGRTYGCAPGRMGRRSDTPTDPTLRVVAHHTHRLVWGCSPLGGSSCMLCGARCPSRCCTFNVCLPLTRARQQICARSFEPLHHVVSLSCPCVECMHACWAPPAGLLQLAFFPITAGSGLLQLAFFPITAGCVLSVASLISRCGAQAGTERLTLTVQIDSNEQLFGGALAHTRAARTTATPTRTRAHSRADGARQPQRGHWAHAPRGLVALHGPCVA